jgi:indole-3-glycerol phosphate synthase
VFHLASQVSPCRGFAQAIAQESNSRLAVIAEIKRRSPSKGNLNIDVDPAVLAQQYESGGATCLSVLTDVEHFAGSAQDLKVAHRSVGLPILRKDFTVDVRDVCDARLMGADAVLLIAAALSASEMVSFHEVATSLGLDVLVEVHDERELEVALKANATMIGVNQRDLVTFQVDHERAVRMGGVIPAGVVRVAESGVRGPDDAQSLRNAGYDAVLVGESLVTASNPAESLRLPRCA